MPQNTIQVIVSAASDGPDNGNAHAQEIFRTHVCISDENQQTVKWLGLVASHKYSRYLQSGGKLRQRELAGSLDGAEGSFLPFEVWTRARKGGERNVLHPHETLGAALHMEDTVHVSIQQTVPVGQDGCPVKSLWSKLAYTGGSRSNEVAQESKGARKERLKRIKTETDQLRGETGVNGAESFREMHDTTFNWTDASAGKIERAVDFDFGIITIDDILPGESAQMEVRRVVSENFATIASLISYYGTNESCPRMGYSECAHLLHSCGTVRLGTEGNATDIDNFNDAFAAAAASSSPESKSDEIEMNALLHRHQFIELLVRVAQSNEYQNKGLPAHVELSRIFEKQLSRRAESFHREPVRIVLINGEARALLKESLGAAAAFDEYCLSSNQRGPAAPFPRTIRLQEACLLLSDAGIVGGGKEKDELGLYKCTRSAFVSAQLDSGVPDGYSGRTLPQITYAEFIECAVRLQMTAPGESSSGVYAALEAALAAFESMAESNSLVERKK